jgi:hypothetical protein
LRMSCTSAMFIEVFVTVIELFPSVPNPEKPMNTGFFEAS